LGIITNIGVSHIENLGSREGILKAKLELVEGMKTGAPLVLNGDDDLLSTVKFDDRPVYFFGIDNENCDFRGTDIVQCENSTSFTVKFDGGSEEIVLPTVGKHNVLDALSAFAVAYLVGAEPKEIAKVLSQYEPSGMRQRVVDCGEFTVIEDCYNASPDSMRASISTLADTKNGTKIAVLGDMLELGEYSADMHRQVGEYVAQSGIDYLLCYGENAKYYVEGALSAGLKNAVHFEKREELFEDIIQRASNGSILLFKASHGMHFEQFISDLYERKGLK
jgi:UDP-N-acetylmuramoyl-tripeptide--D-alanyl-D-alanine ligase